MTALDDFRLAKSCYRVMPCSLQHQSSPAVMATIRNTHHKVYQLCGAHGSSQVSPLSTSTGICTGASLAAKVMRGTRLARRPHRHRRRLVGRGALPPPCDVAESDLAALSHTVRKLCLAGSQRCLLFETSCRVEPLARTPRQCQRLPYQSG